MMKSVFLFVIIAFALVNTYPVEDGDSCCGTEGFDSSRQTCCGTRVHTLRDGYECCGSEYYDSSSETRICCSTDAGDFLSTVSANAENPQCCGKRGYDAESQVCCSEDSSTVVTLPTASGTYSCCGTSRVFNQETQLCCSDRVLTIPNVDNTYECCGTSLYNTETQACCNNVVRTLDSNDNTDQECCGTQLYNTNTQRCCAGTTSSSIFTISGNEDLECCGSTLYDPTTHTCCENVRAVEGFGTCCGTNSLYSEEYQECCSGRIGCGDACCGNMAYWSDEYTCCSSDGKNQLHRGAGQTCCGIEVYDETEYTCCGSTLHKADGCASSCCGEEIYDENFATCCQTVDAETNEVLESELLQGKGSCCRTDIIDEDEDRLVYGSSDSDSREDSRDSSREDSRDSSRSKGRDAKKVKRSVLDSSSQPKLFVLFNEETEVCCPRNGKTDLFKRSCGDTCCGEDGYYASFQTCNCKSEVVNDPTRVFNCCGSKEYFPDDAEDPEVCCADDLTSTPKIHDFDSTGVCCGNEYITSDDEGVVCCF